VKWRKREQGSLPLGEKKRREMEEIDVFIMMECEA